MIRSLLLITLLVLPLSVPLADDRAFDPRAKAVLEEMVKSYRRLKSLEQESVYDSRGSSAARILKTKLVFERPNRLVLDIHERSPQKESSVRRFVSDGKDLYSYSEVEGHFVKDKAPRNLDGFRELATSMEMAAIMGMDPFASLSQQARSARLEEPADLDGISCDVVFIDVGDELRTGEVRLYIGREDRLLRKFLFDSKPIPKPEPKEKKLLPDLPIPGEEPLPPLDPPLPVQFGYQVKVTPNPKLTKETFNWIAPPGAMQLLGAKAILNQNRKADGKSNSWTPAQYTDLNHPTRRIHAKDLVDKANKQRKR